MIPECDRAYIAGLFDGEGCVSYKQYNRKRANNKKAYPTWQIRLEIAMTDKSVLVWLNETLGVGTVTVSAAANVSVTGNQLTIGTGSVTITAAANVSPTGVPMTLTVNDPGIITWQPIDPGASQTWVNIDPY